MLSSYSLRAALAVASLAILSACGTVGSKDFACPGRPEGVRCMSAKDVYQATHESDRVAPTAPNAIGDDPANMPRNKKAASAHEDPGAVNASTPIAPGAPSTAPQSAEQRMILASSIVPAVEKPIPIRTPAQVMRVWVAPWEDERGVLHIGGYSFIEVESRRWVVGETQSGSQPVRFFSIQNAKVETKETGGKAQNAQPARAGESERTNRASSTLSKTGVSK